MDSLDLALGAQYRISGKTAIYLAPEAEPEDEGTACRILLDRGDREAAGFGAEAIHEGPIAHVRAAELATPKDGGRLIVVLQMGDEPVIATYMICAAPVAADPERRQWVLKLVEVSDA